MREISTFFLLKGSINGNEILFEYIQERDDQEDEDYINNTEPSYFKLKILSKNQALVIPCGQEECNLFVVGDLLYKE